MMKWKKESKIIRLRCIKKINKGDDKINRDKKNDICDLILISQ